LIVNLLMICIFTIKEMNTLSPEMVRLIDHTGYLLRLAHDHAHRTKAEQMPGAAHPRDYSMLVALQTTGPISQQRLAEKMRVNRTLIVGIVDDLERRGWVERRRDPGDRRSYQLHVTPAGAQAVAEMGPRVAAASAIMAANLTEAERTRLHELLRGLITADPERLIPPSLADLTGFLIVQAHFLARDRANEAFRDLPIEIRHYGVMVALDELGPTSQQALTNAMAVSATLVTQIVDDLERLGLIERRRNPADRRSYTVTMTAEGKRVLAAARKAAGTIVFPGDDELRPLLRKLVGITR
jgi:DNA-binding MarR family transcriptional regulator